MNDDQVAVFAAIRRAARVARICDAQRQSYMDQARHAIQQMNNGEWDMGDTLVEAESLFDSAYVSHTRAEAIRHAIRAAIESPKQ